MRILIAPMAETSGPFSRAVALCHNLTERGHEVAFCAAVKSGMGWIVKNGVLITKKFGAKVRLGAILIDYPLEAGKAIEESLYGNCKACVNACSWGKNNE